MTEQRFYARMRKALPRVFFQRHEDKYSLGIPDVHGCTDDGVAFWLELKVETRSLTREQHAWITRYNKKKGLAFVLRWFPTMMTLQRYLGFWPGLETVPCEIPNHDFDWMIQMIKETRKVLDAQTGKVTSD